MASGLQLLVALESACEAQGLSCGSRLCARFARVWLQDEIGEAVDARVAIIILGERPGLGTGDGLSAYMVYEPRVGKTDGERNMISNIHSRGIAPEVAARRLAQLARVMVDQGRSGVTLDLSQLPTPKALESAPQHRQKLVEVES